ncbi:flagellar hook-length control protein FliK [Aromatoleum petrolei]|uniref:Flagellar hook-length control protein FliK n=1 Tax=Aromatoleum petrolei TaxID=76116 RepID=A0ABX1MUA4_9RHOO|nr:flagellar hook-length control protein FliK [Aromatoleum petrolei]NMF91338.1 flagellar hook-length control protein FliK [Aromatoleum petrolei]QTQ38116.1 Putative flagellar hook-length control protein [Aromatoleum petrolei]
MIPSDLAARLRLITEASLFDSEPPINGTSRVREIQARLPELLPGERFVATIDRRLPDGTFKAIVGGRDYTLALNHSANTGDTLELVVTQSTPKAVFAQLAEPMLTGNEGARPTLSAAGRLIGFLLTGQPAPQPASLAAGKPIIAAPPTNNAAATLAPALQQALSQSGLFYESHQLQWLSGRLSTSALLQEPQGEHLRRTAPQPAGPADAAALAHSPVPLRAGTEMAANAPAQGAGATAVAANESDAASGTNPAQAPGMRTATLPERLVPVVYQQLDAMATQNYVWQGQIWPGQTMEWEIEDPQRDREPGSDEPPTEWKSTLRLSLPRLGGVEAHLILTPAGVALRLMADDDATVEALANARAELDSALEAANVPLTGFVAERRDGEA